MQVALQSARALMCQLLLVAATWVWWLAGAIVVNGKHALRSRAIGGPLCTLALQLHGVRQDIAGSAGGEAPAQRQESRLFRIHARHTAVLPTTAVLLPLPLLQSTPTTPTAPSPSWARS